MMTRQRNDKHSTEFGLWLREQKSLASSLGFAATNLDYIWSNYKTGDWMLIEEKRYMAKVSYCQRELYAMLHKAIVAGNRTGKYKGVHLLQFENASPDDGRTYWNNVEVSKKELIEILMFKRSPPM